MPSKLPVRVRALIALSFLILLVAILSARWQFPQQDPPKSRNEVVASIGTRSITLHEIEQTVALSLYQVDQQRSQLLHQALQQLIDEELLKTEAFRKGVTVSQLLAGASESEAIARLADLPGPVNN